MEAITKEVKELVTSCLADGKLDSGEILRIGVFVAQKVNAVKNLSGEEKKKAVLLLVEEALKSQMSAEQYQQVGSKFALQVLPVVLDIAVGAARGEFSLGKVNSAGVLSCLMACFSAAQKDVAVSPVPQAAPLVAAPLVAASAALTVRAPETATRAPEPAQEVKKEEVAQAPPAESSSQVSVAPLPELKEESPSETPQTEANPAA